MASGKKRVGRRGVQPASPRLEGAFGFVPFDGEQKMFVAGVEQIGVILAFPDRQTVAIVGRDGLLDMYGEEIRARGIKDSDIRDWWAMARKAIHITGDGRTERLKRYNEFRERRVRPRLTK